MNEKDIALRIAKLRMQKGVSAREMSLSIGQNPAYINSFEIGKASPSLEGFFYICDYLQVTPSQFFDLENKNPTKLDSIISDLKKLDDRQLDNIAMLIKGLIKK